MFDIKNNTYFLIIGRRLKTGLIDNTGDGVIISDWSDSGHRFVQWKYVTERNPCVQDME